MPKNLLFKYEKYIERTFFNYKDYVVCLCVYNII